MEAKIVRTNHKIGPCSPTVTWLASFSY